MFVRPLPPSCSARLWDLFIYEGASALVRLVPQFYGWVFVNWFWVPLKTVLLFFFPPHAKVCACIALLDIAMEETQTPEVLEHFDKFMCEPFHFVAKASSHRWRWSASFLGSLLTLLRWALSIRVQGGLNGLFRSMRRIYSGKCLIHSMLCYACSARYAEVSKHDTFWSAGV